MATLVREAGDALDAITLTLDSHHRLDIAHPGFGGQAHRAPRSGHSRRSPPPPCAIGSSSRETPPPCRAPRDESLRWTRRLLIPKPTQLSNDVGLKPLNIVMKLVRANGQPMATLSDSPGKTMCEDGTFLAYLRQVFGVAPPR